MSLFDVIRYPVSNPPTPDQLEALPDELFMHWIATSDWQEHYGDDIDRKYVANWYQDVWPRMSDEPHIFVQDLRDLDNLRALIRNWDTHNHVHDNSTQATK